jgi:hypothetical protein
MASFKCHETNKAEQCDLVEAIWVDKVGIQILSRGSCKVRNETDRNETKPNETKRNLMNETKHNGTKPDETKIESNQNQN